MNGKRDGIDKNLIIRLGVRPMRTFTYIAEKFTDGKSERRDGFENGSDTGFPLQTLKGKRM